MPDVKMQWIKIYTSIFDDEKIQLIEAMPDADTLLVIWFKLLVLAGKVTANGDIQFSEDMAYTDEMLATIFRRPLNSVRLALQVLSKFKMIKISDNSLCIVNWEKYQNIEGMERVRILTAKRTQEYRDRRKLLQLPQLSLELNKGSDVTVTSRDATDIDIDKNKIENKNNDIERENNNNSLSLITVNDCFLTYENGLGILNETTRDEINTYCQTFPPEWVNDALIIAVGGEEKQRNWNYTKGILKNWATKGRNVTFGDNGHKNIDSKTAKYASHELTGADALEHYRQQKEDKGND